MSLVPLAPFLDFARDDKEGANELRRLTFCAACALRTPSKFYGSSVVGSFEGSCLRWSRSTGHRVRRGPALFGKDAIFGRDVRRRGGRPPTGHCLVLDGDSVGGSPSVKISLGEQRA